MFAIIDTNHDTTPHLHALKAAGVETVIRYLSPINPHGEKCIKPAEARAIAAAGLKLALVCEGWGDFAHGAISAGAGERDGKWCAAYAREVGAPDGAALYFAVDVDASAGQIKKLVLPYFSAIGVALTAAAAKYRRGVYGSGDVCGAVVAAKLADLTWLSCSSGWSGSRAYLASNKWALRQHPPAMIAGIDCDPDDANGDFGAFVPFAAAEKLSQNGSATPAQSETAAGAAALKSYVQSVSVIEAMFVPQSAYDTGAADVIAAADSSSDQSAAGRQRAGAAALRAALTATGESAEVSDAQCAAGAAAVLGAVAKLRARQADVKDQS